VRLVQHPEVWPKPTLGIDKLILAKVLDEVRLIGSDGTHFDPDPMTSEEMGKLKQAVSFMQRLYELVPQQS
jgi:hypothetical protein